MMDQPLAKTWEWLRAHLELGAVGSILVGVSTYVGRLFYSGYFGFYHLDGASITIPLQDSVRTFVIVLVAASVIVALIATVQPRRTLQIGTAFMENLPLFFVILPLGAWAIGFYWSNVVDLSSWLARTVTNPALRDLNATETVRVTHFLRWAVLIGPFVLALIVMAGLSFMRISFSAFVMRHDLRARLVFLGLFVVIALTTAKLCGRAYAHLEFSGVIARPEVAFTLSDGSRFQADRSLYLLMDADEVYYVAARPVASDERVHVWLVPRSAIKSAEFKSEPVSTVPLLDVILGSRDG